MPAAVAAPHSGFYAAGPALSLGVQAQLDDEREPVQREVEEHDEQSAPMQPPREGEDDDGADVGLFRAAQLGATGAAPPAAIAPVAAHGLSAAAQPLPGLGSIQRAFGRHSLADVRVQVGGPARVASEQLGARAYTRGSRIAFKEAPDLKLAAHEAAHVVQQRRGVHLKNGISAPGDAYEQQADRVAEAVQTGRSAEGLLDEQPHRSPNAVQRCACGGAGCAACAQAEGKAAEEEQPVQAQLEVSASRLYEPGAAPVAGGEAESEQAAGQPEGAPAQAPPGADGAVAAGEGAAGAAEGAAPAPLAAGGPTGAAAPGGASQPQGSARAAAAQPDADTGAPAAARPAPTGGGASPAGSGAAGATSAPASAASTGAGPAAAPGGGPASARGAAPASAPGGPGGRQTETAGAGEQACKGSAANAECYRAGIEEPETEPEGGEPKEPPSTEAVERMWSESPQAQPNDECPVGTAVEAQAPAPGDALQSAAAPGGAGAGPAGPAPAGQPGGAAQPAAGGPEAEGQAAAAPAAEGQAGPAPGGQGGGAEAASGDEGGPAANPLDAAIEAGEAQRDSAVEAYQASSSRLEGLGDGIRGLAGEPNLAPAEGGAEERSQRDLARSRAGSFFREATRGMAEVVEQARDQIPDQLGGLAATVKAGIGDQIEREKQAISRRISTARFAAQASAAIARAQVKSGHASTVAAIRTATDQARAKLTVEHLRALADTTTKETAGLGAVNAAYVKSRGEHEQAGVKIGGEAITAGEAYYNRYETCKIHRKDGFWAGYLTDRRAEAQQKAAREVAKGYKKSLEQTAKDQARELIKGRQKDRCAIIAQARKARETLDGQIQALTGALDAGRDQAIAEADARRDGLLRSISSSLRATLAGLSRQEQTQRQAANDTGYLQQVAIEQAAHAGVAALQGSVAEAIDAIQDGLQSARAMLAETAAPDPEELGKTLGQQAAKLGGGLSRLKAQVSAGSVAAGLRLGASGAGAAKALAQVTTANDNQADAASAGFARSMRALGASARSAFAQQAAQYRTQAQTTATDGTAALKGVATGLQTSINTTTDNITKALGESKTRLEESLRQSLSGIHCEIPLRANQAAAKEQPAWKKVVAVILIIAVVIVVALVIGPAVIGAVGAAAGALGASAGAAAVIGTVVGGAIVGAATSATIQVLNNWRTGERLSAGVGRAALIGAVGGVFGAGAGALIGKYVASGALQFAANVAADAVFDVATQLVTTGSFSWGDFAQGLATSLATGGFGSFSRVKGIQARVQHRAARVVPGAGARSFAQSIRPGGSAEAPPPTRPTAETEAGPAPRPTAEAETPAAPRPVAEAEAGPAPRPTAEAETPAAPRPTAETEAGPAPRPTAEADTTAVPPRPAAEAEARSAPRGAPEAETGPASTRPQASPETAETPQARPAAPDLGTGYRETVGFSGRPTKTPAAGHEHLGFIQRGLELGNRLIPNLRGRLRAALDPLPVQRRRLAALDREVSDINARDGKVLSAPRHKVETESTFGRTPAERQAAAARRDRAVQRLNDIETEAARLRSELETARVQGDADALGLMTQLRGRLLNRGRASARGRVEQLTIEPSAQRVFEGKGRGQRALRDIHEFYELAGAHAPDPSLIRVESTRPRADAPPGRVNVGSGGSKSTIFHEFGHHVEYGRPAVAHASETFRGARSARAGHTGPPEPLGTGYRADEVALPGDFITPYTGKVYSDPITPGGVRPTEVVTTGLERFTDPQSMLRFYRQDPEHFLYILGVLH